MNDEGVFYNGTAAFLNVTINTAGFRLISVADDSFKGNPIFVQANNFVRFTVVITRESGEFSGPVTVGFDAQPA